MANLDNSKFNGQLATTLKAFYRNKSVENNETEKTSVKSDLAPNVSNLQTDCVTTNRIKETIKYSPSYGNYETL